jgi:hypothetical protein
MMRVMSWVKEKEKGISVFFNKSSLFPFCPPKSESGFPREKDMSEPQPKLGNVLARVGGPMTFRLISQPIWAKTCVFRYDTGPFHVAKRSRYLYR